MKSYMELNERDIEKIIAEYYNTDLENVELNLYLTTRGYGESEHQEPTMYVRVFDEGING